MPGTKASFPYGSLHFRILLGLDHAPERSKWRVKQDESRMGRFIGQTVRHQANGERCVCNGSDSLSVGRATDSIDKDVVLLHLEPDSNL